MAAHEKVRYKMEQIARYRVAGMKDAEICRIVGYTPQGLARVVALADYEEISAGVQASLLGKMDATLAQQRCDPLTQQLQALVESVTQTRDLRCRMEAAKQILDREPQRRFTQASRASAAGDNPPPGASTGSARLPAALLAQLASDHAAGVKAINEANAVKVAADAEQALRNLTVQDLAPGVN